MSGGVVNECVGCAAPSMPGLPDGRSGGTGPPAPASLALHSTERPTAMAGSPVPTMAAHPRLIYHWLHLFMLHTASQGRHDSPADQAAGSRQQALVPLQVRRGGKGAGPGPTRQLSHGVVVQLLQLRQRKLEAQLVVVRSGARVAAQVHARQAAPLAAERRLHLV